MLSKGLNFSILPNKLHYADYCLNFELLYRDIRNMDLNDKNKQDFIKTKLKDVALTSFYNYNNDNVKPNNLTKEEFEALQILSKKHNIIVQKSDKGNAIVIIDRDSYIDRINEILNDNSKFTHLTPNIIKSGKELQYIDKAEEKIRIFLKKLLRCGKISKSEFNKLYPIGSQPGVLYGLPKVHKLLVGGIPKYRLILSTIGTCSSKLAKFLVPILDDISHNEFTIKDSFSFGKEVLGMDSSLFMGSLDIEALFTSLPLNETINITVDLMFKDNELVNNLNREEFRELLVFATNEPWFIFNEQF